MFLFYASHRAWLKCHTKKFITNTCCKYMLIYTYDVIRLKN